MESINPISAALREAREQRKFTIADISQLTSIRPHVVSAIDEGNLSVLPSVYVRSFIKKYAGVVGIADEEIEQLMNTHLAQSVKSAPTKSEEVRSTKSSTKSSSTEPSTSAPKSYVNQSLSSIGTTQSKRTWGIVGGVVLLLASALGIYKLYSPSTPENPKTPAAPVVVGDTESSNSGGLLSYFGETVSGDSLALEAVANDTAWIGITIDSDKSEQVTLYPQNTKRWTGNKQFVLSVGNAGGVTLYRNGVQLPPLGKKGETVRKITIKAKEFITSSSPWRSQRDTSKRRPQQNPTAPAQTLPKPQNSSPSAIVPTKVYTAPSATSGKPAATKTPIAQSPKPTVSAPIKQPVAKPNAVAPADSKVSGTSTTTKPLVAPKKELAPKATTIKPPVTDASTPTVAVEKKKTAPKKPTLTPEEIERKKRIKEIMNRAKNPPELTPAPLKPISKPEEKTP